MRSIALLSIWRTRSRETPRRPPIAASVRGGAPSSPYRWTTIVRHSGGSCPVARATSAAPSSCRIDSRGAADPSARMSLHLCASRAETGASSETSRGGYEPRDLDSGRRTIRDWLWTRFCIRRRAHHEAYVAN